MSEDKNTFDDCYVEPHAWQKVVKAELQEMDRQSSHRLIGLAMSGGGIRSASFSLGALQAMVAAGRLKDVDYMSTVSGGGYVGSALTWFTNYAGEEGGEPCFGVTAGDFPLGMKEAAPLSPAPNYDRDTPLEEFPDKEDPDRVAEKTRNQPKIDRLEHIRQNGNYLRPGTVFELISMIWMILQSMLVPLIVYFLLLFVPLAALAYGVHSILPHPNDVPWLAKVHDASFRTVNRSSHGPFCSALASRSWPFSFSPSFSPSDLRSDRRMATGLTI